VFKEKAVATSDGRWFNIRMMPYRTTEDKIDGLVITFIDITKSKLLENALLENERMLRSFIQAVPGVIIGLSHEGNVIEFNTEAEKLFGRKRKDVIGKGYVDLFIVESSRRKVETELNSLLKGVLPNRYENRVKTHGGDELKIEWSAHKFLGAEGLLIGIIAVGEKITKPKR
jgi:two-component system CheB/CheR fusion protein